MKKAAITMVREDSADAHTHVHVRANPDVGLIQEVMLLASVLSPD